MRDLSQLELSAQCGISQKHISFVESGRSLPSRPLLMKLGQALDIPLRERNDLLFAAGYAPAYANEPLGASALQGVHRALERMLRQHEPFPAVVMDRHWNVVLANEAVPRFFGCFVDLDARPAPRNLLHLMFDPAGMRPFIANWPEASQSLLSRVRREAVGQVVDLQTRSLIQALGQYPDVPPPGPVQSQDDDIPVVPLTFAKDGEVLRYFSLVASVGTPRSVAAEELRLECMFPADDATEAAHAGFIAKYSSR